MQIIKLDEKLYKGQQYVFEYDTAAYYDVSITQTAISYDLHFERKDMPRTHKKFTSRLFEAHWDAPQAYGLIDNEGKLCAIMEITKEEWNNRLRITNILVFDGFRRRGYGSLLMFKAKTLARSMGCRAIVLETQSCNVGAIRFYHAQGFTLIGFNTCEYTNKDVENREMRMEMGLLITP